MFTPRRPTFAWVAVLFVLQALPAQSPPRAEGVPTTTDLRGFAMSPKAGSMDPVLLSLLAEVGPTGRMGAFIQFAGDVSHAEGMSAVERAGLTVGLELPAAHAVYAHGRAEDLVAGSWAVEVSYLENTGIGELHNDTGTWATRARTLYEAPGGLDLRLEDPSGQVIDGSGVGIAIIDSGVDGNHPDLKWCNGADPSTCKTVQNFKVECTTPVLINTGTQQCFGQVTFTANADTDTSSGHGSHVSGIAAGEGTASDSDGNPSTTGDRMFRGVAPGAKLYGFGCGEGLSILILNAAAAFQWIYDNGPSQNPPIRVVNNSWGGTGAPSSTIVKLVDALIKDRKITVVFSAGNGGGDGTTSTTNSYGNNQTPGVLSVANYDDDLRGTRDFGLDSTSSRGAASNPATWPDISAPGTLITSSCIREGKPVCNFGFIDEAAWFPYYSTISGTSMASPHVAGVVALLYQADPDITPAEVEDVLEDTAYKFAFGTAYAPDPTNPDDTSSFDKGHGLADARQAVLARVGLPSNTGTSTGGGSPSVSIGNPADGETVPPGFRVLGGASTGAGAVGTLVTVLASGDGGDHQVDSLDLEQVTLVEDPNLGTVTVNWTVRGTTVPPAPTNTYRLFSNINGTTRRLQVLWDGVTGNVTNASDCGAATCPIEALAVGKTGNSFFATFAASVLGVTRGDIHFDSWAAAYAQVIQDRAPGGEGGTFITEPARGQEHVFVSDGPSSPGPLGTVRLSVDGGAFGAPVGSDLGEFMWDDQQNLPARPACYEITAGLWLEPDGPPAAPDAQDMACVVVQEQQVVPTLTITVPADGTQAPAQVIVVRGIANYDLAEGPASVQVRGIGNAGYETFEFPAQDDATGGPPFTRWSAEMDLTTALGQQVAITARLFLNGGARTVDTVTVNVVIGAGAVPDGGRVPGVPLTLGKVGGGDISLSWGASCQSTDTDYQVYEGQMGDFTSHQQRFCSTSGATTTTLTPSSGSAYYLVVPRNATEEGSYGTDSSGMERLQGPTACLPQGYSPCQ